MNAIKIPQRHNLVRKWRKFFCDFPTDKNCNCIGCKTVKIVYYAFGEAGLKFFMDKFQSNRDFKQENDEYPANILTSIPRNDIFLGIFSYKIN